MKLSHLRCVLCVLSSLIMATLVISCSSNNGSGSSSQSAGGRQYKVIGDASRIQQTGNAITGFGKVLFLDPLPGDQKNKFKLEFKIADNGEFRHIANSKADLTGGVEFIFARRGADVLSTIRLDGGNLVDVTAALRPAVTDANGTIAMEVEIHNDESPVHVIVKSALGDELFDSEEAGVALGNGAGNFYGANLTDSTLVDSTPTKVAGHTHEHHHH